MKKLYRFCVRALSPLDDGTVEINEHVGTESELKDNILVIRNECTDTCVAYARGRWFEVTSRPEKA